MLLELIFNHILLTTTLVSCLHLEGTGMILMAVVRRQGDPPRKRGIHSTQQPPHRNGGPMSLIFRLHNRGQALGVLSKCKCRSHFKANKKDALGANKASYLAHSSLQLSIQQKFTPQPDFPSLEGLFTDGFLHTSPTSLGFVFYTQFKKKKFQSSQVTCSSQYMTAMVPQKDTFSVLVWLRSLGIGV